ncbi:sodium:solute symporter family transporter [Rhizomicrobium electricum]|uniref:Sodium/sugar symporter n=1 Tax=Rhizomicrobium electricum TaxID=480070 RepID=A0ABN1EE45_9PROT|nr:sodium/solute symporter [Rhizomicrobium electricum]NIJ48686.1 SSS family solute:Na+ symporter [Rhizomicrobium electricum]
MHLGFKDIIVILIYAVLVLAVAHLFQRGERRDDEDGDDTPVRRALPWWAIGASLIAANISAEQIIGMSGSAYAIGIAIAGYEWLAAFAMVVIGKYFLPVFLKNQISTMPQFLRLRYGPKTQVTMALMWLALYTFVNLTAVMWLGATAVHVVTGLNMTVSVILLGLVAGNYALYVGLKSTHFTDVVQVGMLVLGGIVILVFALEKIAGSIGAPGGVQGIVSGLHAMATRMPDHFHMILDPSHPYYKYLPGIVTVGGAMWLIQFSYWGFNQYIVQRALTARSIREVQKGVVFAAYLKLLMPALVVLPGIAAAFLLPGIAPSDTAYPWLMTTLPPGFLGFVFVALVAAIIASTGSSLSSIAKIFTHDVIEVVYPGATRRLLVIVGKFGAIGALIVAMAVASPLLGHTDQAFQYIQEFTGFLTPGVIVIFVLGMFWPRTTETGALLAAAGTVIASTAYALFLPQMPFMIRMGHVFLICLTLAVGGSLATKPKRETAIDLSGIDYSTSHGYNIAAGAIAVILAGLYWYLW